MRTLVVCPSDLLVYGIQITQTYPRRHKLETLLPTFLETDIMLCQQQYLHLRRHWWCSKKCMYRCSILNIFIHFKRHFKYRQKCVQYKLKVSLLLPGRLPLPGRLLLPSGLGYRSPAGCHSPAGYCSLAGAWPVADLLLDSR